MNQCFVISSGMSRQRCHLCRKSLGARTIWLCISQCFPVAAVVGGTGLNIHSLHHSTTLAVIPQWRAETTLRCHHTWRAGKWTIDLCLIFLETSIQFGDFPASHVWLPEGIQHQHLLFDKSSLIGQFKLLILDQVCCFVEPTDGSSTNSVHYWLEWALPAGSDGILASLFGSKGSHLPHEHNEIWS